MYKEIKTDRQKWAKIEKALRRLNLFSKTKLTQQLTHGLCPECYRSLVDEIDNIK